MRKDTAILAGTTLIGAILAFHFWSQLKEDGKLIAGLRQQVEKLQTARIAESALQTSSAGALNAGALQPESVLAAASMSKGPSASAVPAAMPNQGRVRSEESILQCENTLARLKQNSAVETAALTAELKLAPFEAQKFAEIRESLVAGALSCRPDGRSTASPEPLEVQVLAALGPGRLEQLQEINTRRTAQQNMTTLGTQLSQSGAPLNEDQARQLTATILEESRRTRREATSPVPPTEPRARVAYQEENLRLTEERFERILKAAQSYLRPEQLAQLRGNMTRQAIAMRSSVEQMRSSVDAGRGIPASQPAIGISISVRD